MQHNSVFDAAREALRQSDTARALELVIAHLEATRQHADTVRTLRVVEANYHAARQQELKGILAFNEAQREYNKLNDNLLAVLDALAEGKTLPPLVTPARPHWASRQQSISAGGRSNDRLQCRSGQPGYIRCEAAGPNL